LCLTLLSLFACGKDTPAVPPDPPAPGDAAAAAPDAMSATSATDTAATTATSPTTIGDAPRPRSEPPPRPPLPDGIKRFDKDVITLSLSGDGRYLAGGDLAGKSLLWDLESGRFLWGDPTPIGSRIGRVVFAEVGDIWVGGSFDEPDRPWRAWSATRLERRGEFGTAGEIAIDLALDKNGETAVVLTSSQDGERQIVSAWKLASDRPLWSAPALQSRRGAVAISPDGAQVAVSDDRGGLVRFGWPAPAGAAEPFVRTVLAEPSADAVPDRIARLAWLESGPRAGLWAAQKAGLTRYPPTGDGGVSAPEPVVALEAGEAAGVTPIRGLHRISRGGETTLVAVTRPEAGGLVLWGLDGKVVGELVTDCRCETHALSFDGRVGACGCAPASEIRYGAIRWR
jgi:hypothetical protein